MKSKEFFSALDAMAAERGLTQEEILADFSEAMTIGLRKMFGEGRGVRVELDPKKSTIKCVAYRVVVDTDDVEDWEREVSLTEALETNPKAKAGDVMEEEVNPKDLGRVAAIAMKQFMNQKNRERTREAAMTEINARADQIITARITRSDRDAYHLEIPGSSIEGILNTRAQIPGQAHRVGDFIKVYVNPSYDDRRGEIYVTRSTPQFVKALFDLEVPELGRGEVEVKAIAREAGYRTKLCVTSDVPGVDPIGACVGNKGSRIQSVLSELGGEKIDLIPWSDEPLEFIAAALSPSPVISVEAIDGENRARVIVPNDKLSLAIGKGGMNVRLAAKLTGWKIDVLSEEKAAQLASA